MTTALRSLAFNIANLLFLAVLGVFGLPALASRNSTMRLGRFWARRVLGMLRVIVGLRYEVRGREHMPPGPAIYAMKHQSAWETIAFLILVPDFAGVFKRELLRIPVYGWYAARLGMIPVDRASGGTALRRMVRRAKAEIAEGRSIMIMPEGTRVAPGEAGTYHPGVAALYKSLDVPVVPIALNSGLYWRRRGFLKRPGTVIFEFLEPLAPGLERGEFMAELRRRIEDAAAALHQEGLARDFGRPAAERA